MQVPEHLPYGMFTIEAVAGAEGKVLAVADFVKSYSDEERERTEPPRKRVNVNGTVNPDAP